MSYVDAYFDRGKDTIYAVERNNGIREYREFPVTYNAYFDDPGGKHTSIYGTKVSRISERSSSKFQKELKVNSHRRLFENDMKKQVRDSDLEDGKVGVCNRIAFV